MSRRTHVEEDEDGAAPLDLRLVPFAVAAWAGALSGLIGAPRVTAGVVAVLVLIVLVGCRAGRRAGGLVVAVGVVTGALVAGLHWWSAVRDPMVAAAAEGRWATAVVTVAGPATALPGAAPAAKGTDHGAVTTSAAGLRWRLPVTPVSLSVADRRWAPAAGLTVVGTGADWPALIPGARIRVAGLLGPDQRAVLPAVVLAARGPPQPDRSAPWWQRGADRLRRGLVSASAGLSPDARGLLPGLVDGDLTGVSDELSADARTTGLTHLLAVSGAQFAVLAGVVLLLTRRLGPRLSASAAAVTSAGVVVLVGPSPSVLRAAVMGAVALVGLAVGRPRSALPAVAFAVVVLLLMDPALAVSAGFALSVLATAALIVCAPYWSKGLQRRGWPRGPAELVAVPAAASLASMPVIAALSGSVSLASVPANLLAAPVVAPALLLGVIAMLLAPWWPEAALGVAQVAEPLLAWIAGVAHRLARWSLATVPWPASVPGVLALTGLALAAVLALRQARVRALALAGAAGLSAVLVPAQAVSLGWPPPGWLLVGCEVGQGDGMVLSTGQPGVGIVYDAGPDPALMSECLDRLGVVTVPLLVITHLHADHVNGIPGVLAGRNVGAIGVGPDREPAAAWTTMNREAAERRIPVVALTPGTRYTSGELVLTVLAPAHVFTGTDSDPNNDSVTSMVVIRGTRILMTGDIQVEAQQALLNSKVDLRADVLEEPHHGSAKFLPDFLAAVSPRVSVIGVGLGNDYGLPSPRTLSRLAQADVTVVRTDLQGDAAVGLVDGALQVTTRGARLHASRAGPVPAAPGPATGTVPVTSAHRP